MKHVTSVGRRKDGKATAATKRVADHLSTWLDMFEECNPEHNEWTLFEAYNAARTIEGLRKCDHGTFVREFRRLRPHMAATPPAGDG